MEAEQVVEERVTDEDIEVLFFIIATTNLII